MTSNNLTDWVSPHLKVSLGLDFYKVPERASAIFSTKNGAISKRKLTLPPSPPVAKSDVDAEIRRKATSLREEFPAIVRTISHPLTNWYDLHKYFDGVDLWYEGAAFLYYVLNHISNENAALDHDLEESKQAEIRDWAKLWVEANLQRILSFPATQNLIAIFSKEEQDSINGLDKKQLALLGNALNLFRKEFDHLRPPIEEKKLQAPPQSVQGMHQHVHAQPYHPAQHHHLQQSQPMMHQGPPIIQHGPPMGGQPYPVVISEHHRNQMMQMQPMPHMQPQPPLQPSHQTFQNFMERQRNIATFNPTPPQGPGDFRQDVNPQWERRQRGYSNETARGGRGGRGNAHFNNFGTQNRSFQQFDRRMVNNNSTPKGSPLRRVSQLNQVNEGTVPVYVHSSQRQSPPFDGDATPRASGRGMQNMQRVVSDPSGGRSTFSNDARLWQPNSRQRSNSKPQEAANDHRPPPPFEADPQATIVIRDPYHKSICTYWYEGPPRPMTYDGQRPRTVYVRNFARDHLESHDLKRLFAKYGTVESISYLFASYPNGRGGPAFIAFMEEASVEPAIEGLHGYEIAPCAILTVNPPNHRSRSGSYSSQNEHEQNYPLNCAGSRDFQHGGFHRRGPSRNQSISYRAPAYAGGMRGHIRGSSNSAEAPNTSQAPLTEGFQAQLQSTQPFQTHIGAEPLNSTVAEVLQHQAAMNRYPNPSYTPLGNIENRNHGRKMSVNLDNSAEQDRMVMSQGSYNKKENSPKKKGSNKNTPFTSPKKDLSRPQAGDNNQKGNGSKNKKGNKQNTSTRPSRAPSPAKSNFEGMLLAAMAKEQKQAEDCSENITPKPSANAAIIGAADSKLDEAATDISKLVDHVGASVKANYLELVGPAINIHEANQLPDIPLIVAGTSLEQPSSPSSEPEISEAVHQNTFASENEFKPHIEKSPAPSLCEGREVTPGVEEEKPQKSKAKKKKQKQRKSIPKSPNASLTSQDSSEVLKASFMTESIENFVTAFSSPNPNLASGPSEPCLCPADPPKPNLDTEPAVSNPLVSKDQVGIKHSKTDSGASTDSTATPKSTVKPGKKQRGTHSKKGSDGSNISTGSVRKADVKSSKPGDKLDETTKAPAGDNIRDQKENHPVTPIVNLEDPTQWPPLGPAKGALPVVDDKPAVPVLQPLSERKKNPNTPIIPAVPLNLQRRRPSIDSTAWPIIKKCDVK